MCLILLFINLNTWAEKTFLGLTNPKVKKKKKNANQELAGFTFSRRVEIFKSYANNASRTYLFIKAKVQRGLIMEKRRAKVGLSRKFVSLPSSSFLSQESRKCQKP